MSNYVYAPCEGKVIPIEEVNDPVFNQKMIGDGFGVVLQNNEICAPADGQINMLFPTGHAFGMILENGLELLVHIGIETVNEEGKGFTTLKNEGDSVLKGEPIIKVDLDYLKSKYDMTVIVVMTNGSEYQYQIDINNKEIVKY